MTGRMRCARVPTAAVATVRARTWTFVGADREGAAAGQGRTTRGRPGRAHRGRARPSDGTGVPAPPTIRVPTAGSDAAQRSVDARATRVRHLVGQSHGPGEQVRL